MSLLLPPLPKKHASRGEEGKREEVKREKKPSLARRGDISPLIAVLIGVVVLVLAIVIAVFVFHVSSGALGSVGTLSPAGATINPDGSITATVTAVGGDVNLQGLAVYSSGGVIATVGSVPVSGASDCSLEAIYINGKSITSWPSGGVVIPNGQSATIVLTKGCQGALSITYWYNNGKEVSTPIS
jgi:uncharacterized protein (UPF0333 family)